MAAVFSAAMVRARAAAGALPRERAWCAGFRRDWRLAWRWHSGVVLGQGEAMFAGIDLPALGYRVTEHQASEHATHISVSRWEMELMPRQALETISTRPRRSAAACRVISVNFEIQMGQWIT
jgi:hypothetical protein